MILLFLKFQILLKDIRNIIGELKEAYYCYIGHLNLEKLKRTTESSENLLIIYNLTNLKKKEKKENTTIKDGNEASSEEEEIPLTQEEVISYLEVK